MKLYLYILLLLPSLGWGQTNTALRIASEGDQGNWLIAYNPKGIGAKLRSIKSLIWVELKDGKEVSSHKMTLKSGEWVLTLPQSQAPRIFYFKSGTQKDTNRGKYWILPAAQMVASPFYTVSEYDPSRDPATDLKNTLEQAKREGKQVILFVGGEWCSWCHALTRYFKKTEGVARLLSAHYLIMKVNFSPENENTTFLSQYPEISGYPHLFFLDEGGRLRHSQDTGVLESGLGMEYNESRILEMLNRWKR